MSPEEPTLGVAAIMFFAALTRSTFGFGEALVAMPLLTQLINVPEATALVAVNSSFNSVMILAADKGRIDWRGGWRLLVASIVGIPVGVFLLTGAPESLVKLLLAMVLLLFSAYNLRRPGAWRLTRDSWAFPFGFIGGALGGAYNTSGPAFVIYGSLRGWTPAQFRSTLQGIFLPNSTWVLFMHWAAGLWSLTVMHYLLCTVPLVALTVPLGCELNRRIHPERFQRILHGLLIILAALLLCSVLAKMTSNSTSRRDSNRSPRATGQAAVYYSGSGCVDRR